MSDGGLSSIASASPAVDEITTSPEKMSLVFEELFDGESSTCYLPDELDNVLGRPSSTSNGIPEIDYVDENGAPDTSTTPSTDESDNASETSEEEKLDSKEVKIEDKDDAADANDADHVHLNEIEEITELDIARCNLDDQKQSDRGTGSGGLDGVSGESLEREMHAPPKNFMQHQDEDDTSATWRSHKRHFFILSHAGKPIYSRYGDEHKLAGFSATLQAIISFMEYSGDCIRFIQAGNHQIVFLIKGPIYLVSVSATDEPISAVKGQLELLHGQLLLILTRSLEKCFVKNANFDLRSLLGGTESVFSSLIQSFNRNPSSFLHSYTCLRLPAKARQAAGSALQHIAHSDLLFGLLLSNSKVISLIGTQKGSLHPDDILLLSNFVVSSESFRTTESFLPICLPKYNASVFLYAYINYVDTNTCLVMITSQSDFFFHLKECRMKIEIFLREAHVLSDIANSVRDGCLRVEDLPGDMLHVSVDRSSWFSRKPVEPDMSSKERAGIGAPGGLRHFMYKSVYLDQYVASEFSSSLYTKKLQKSLLRAYERLYASIHDGPAGSHQMQYQRDENYVLLAWSTMDFEFFAAFDPLAEKSLAITVCNHVCQWIRDLESEIFFSGASPFNW